MRPRPFKRNFFPPSGPKSITTLKAGPSHISRRLAIAVYKRSCRDIFRVNIGSRQRKQNLEKGRPVETAAAVEIGSGGLRQLLLDDFHKLLEKAFAKTAPAFSQFQQARRRPLNNKTTTGEKSERGLLDMVLMETVGIREERADSHSSHKPAGRLAASQSGDRNVTHDHFVRMWRSQASEDRRKRGKWQRYSAQWCGSRMPGD